MYIAQVQNTLHDWWRYIIGVIIAIFGVFVFSVPHLIGLGYKVAQGELEASQLEDVSAVMTAFSSNVNLIFIILPFLGGLLFLLFAVKKLHEQSITSLTTARNTVDLKRIFFAFFFWGILSSGLVLLDYAVTPEDYVLNFNWQPFIILCLISFLLLPFQTSFEEYLFRGYLMQGIGYFVKNKWFPLLLTSVVFGLLHIANPEVDKLGYGVMVYYIGTGLFLGILTLMDDGMELALGFHAANNIFTALLVTADWTALQTDSIFKDISDPSLGFVELIAPVFIMFPLLLFIFGKVYKWNNWKERLIGKVNVYQKPVDPDYSILSDAEDLE